MPVEVRNYVRQIAAGGKFVVLEATDGGRNDLFLISDFSRDGQHMDIVRRWERAEGKTVSEARLQVQGGGWWKQTGDTLMLYGRSAAYGRYDTGWVERHILPGMVGTETNILAQ